MDVTVAIGTFGSKGWFHLAQDRARPSAEALDVPCWLMHADTLHEARNAALDCVTTEWVCFLDADDELEPGYFDAMATGLADLRAPSVRYIRNGQAQAPRVPRVAGHDHPCDAGCLDYGNWLVIGTLVRTELVRSIGGFRDFPVYEDWDLWLRCHQAGATIEALPGAVYRAHVRPDSRNRGMLTQAEKHDVHQRIARANRVPVPA